MHKCKEKITAIPAGRNNDYPGSLQIIIRRTKQDVEDVLLLVGEVEGELFFDVAVADSSVATITLDKDFNPSAKVYKT
jgi:hypothetical protein